MDDSLASTAISIEGSAVSSSRSRQLKQKRLKKAVVAAATRSARHPTQLWMCDQGCCSIRWKLDYAEFQSYTIYAQVSPYVVVQDKTGRCACVICKGLPEKQPSSPSPSKVVRKACESYRLNANVLQEMLPAAATASPSASSTASSSLMPSSPSDSSIADDEDEDDGSI